MSYNSDMISGSSSTKIEKLTGAANYHSWRCDYQALLEDLDLDQYLTSKAYMSNTPENVKEHKKAFAKMKLSLNDYYKAKVENCTTVLEAWNLLHDELAPSNT
ncbi:hypothetical protein ROZALSC1DRAFT_26090, partial [Rozella allomycis CSF55]